MIYFVLRERAAQTAGTSAAAGFNSIENTTSIDVVYKKADTTRINNYC